MKPIKIRVMMFLPILLLLIACVNNQRDTGAASSEETVMIEFIAIELTELNEFFQDFFTGFDPAHIYNFHYADVTSDWSESRIPAPTDPRIQGFFNITEEAWNYYINDDDLWSNLEEAWSEIGTIPDIFEVDNSQINWTRSTSFIDRHRGERIGGAFLVSKENRLVWFHLWRS